MNPLNGEHGKAGRVLAVKIDNVGRHMKSLQTGLGQADLIYVVQVEGGLSRYMAIYDGSHLPSQAGPVRSARQTDLPILKAYGTVDYVYSGAISAMLPMLDHADVHRVTPGSGLFTNGGSIPTFVSPRAVLSQFPNAAQAKDVGLKFGAAPAGGMPVNATTIKMPSASFTFWPSGSTWVMNSDGRQVNDVHPSNVIVQHVRVVPGLFTDHNAGHPDNEVFSRTTGSGAAEVYRDGKVFHGTWNKPSDTSKTSYSVPLRPGQTWIILA